MFTDLKLQQQKLEFFKERLQMQDERIGDLGLMIGFFGALITAMVVFFSIRSKSEAMGAAKDAAHEEINKRANKYIETVLRAEVDKALKDIMEAAGKRLDDLEKAVIDKLAFIPLDKDKPLTPEQKQEVEKAAKNLESVPPKEYRSSDWRLLGIQAFEQGKYEIAAEHFNMSANVAESPVDMAKALFNKGITLGKLQRREETIAVYDEMVKRYGEAPEAALRDLVASTLVNKGVALGQLQRHEDAIAVYDEVVKRYGDAPEATLRESAAMGLLNKCAALGELNRNEKAIVVCDEVVNRYGEAPEEALSYQVAGALLYKSVTLGQLQRHEEAIAICDEVVNRYGEAPGVVLRELVEVARSNKKLIQSNKPN